MKDFKWKKKGILVLLAFLVFAFLIFLLPGKHKKQFSQEPFLKETKETIEYVSGVEDNYNFNLISTETIRQNNLDIFVTVSDEHKNKVKLKVIYSKYQTFNIRPQETYRKGGVYTIKLNKCKFENERYKDISTLTFEVQKDDVYNVAYNKGVQKINSSLVINKDDFQIELRKDEINLFSIGDILIFNQINEEGNIIEIAVKLLRVIRTNPKSIVYEIIEPSIQEVYSNLDIYGSFSPKEEDLYIASPDYLANQILNLDIVKQMSFAVDVLNGEFDITNIEIPDINKDFEAGPVDLSIKLENFKFDPLEFDGTVTASWEVLDNKSKKVNAEISIKIDLIIKLHLKLESISNYNENTDTYVTTTMTTTNLNALFKIYIPAHYKASNSSSFFNKIDLVTFQKYNDAQKLKKYDAEWAVKSLAGGERYVRSKDEKGNFLYDENGGKVWEVSKDSKTATFIKDANGNFVRSLPESMAISEFSKNEKGQYIAASKEQREEIGKSINDLVEIYKNNNKSAAKSDNIKLLSYYLIMPYGFTFSATVGIKITIDFNATVSGEFKLDFYDEQKVISTSDDCNTVSNHIITWSFSLLIEGQLEIRVGIVLESKVSFLEIFYANLTFEGGGYFEFKGVLAIFFGDVSKDQFFEENSLKDIIPDLETDRFFGYGVVDYGRYTQCDLEVGMKIEFLGVKKDWKKKFPFVKEKISMKPVDIDNENHLYIDLAFLSEIEWSLNNEQINSLKNFNVITDDNIYNDDYINSCVNNLKSDIIISKVFRSVDFPVVVRREVDLFSGNIKYYPLRPEEMEIHNANNIEISNGSIWQKGNEKFISENIVITENSKKLANSPFLFTIVEKDFTELERIEVKVPYNEREAILGSVVHLGTYLYPSDATIEKIDFKIVRITRNSGKQYISDPSTYLVNKDDVSADLYISNNLEVGDCIVIMNSFKKVYSNEIIIKVARTDVEEISFSSPGIGSLVTLNQIITFDFSVLPTNSTVLKTNSPSLSFDKDGEVTESFIGTISSDKKSLIINGDSNILNKEFTIFGIINDNGKTISQSKTFKIVKQIPGELRILGESDEELNGANYLKPGDSIKLKPIAIPLSADLSNPIEILKNVDNRYVTIDPITCTLVISELTPVGYTFMLSSRYDTLNSSNYSFEIVDIPLESIDLIIPGNINYMDRNEIKKLKINLTPDNTTQNKIEYVILEGNEFAEIDQFGNIKINNNTLLGAKISVVARVGSIESNAVAIIVPLRDFILETTSTIVKRDETLEIIPNIYPDFETEGIINYYILQDGEFIKDGKYAVVDDNGIIAVKSEISEFNASFQVTAECSGFFSNILTFIVYIPVDEVFLNIKLDNLDGSQSDVNELTLILGQSFEYDYRILPMNSSNKEVTIWYYLDELIVEESEVVRRESRYMQILNRKQNVDKILKVIFIVDGIESNSILISIKREQVKEVNFSDSYPTKDEMIYLVLDQGSLFTLTASVTPRNATFSEISYFIEEGEGESQIMGNYLYIKGDAIVGSIIKINAMADGVYSINSLYIEVSNSLIEKVETKLDNSSEIVESGSTVFIYSVTTPLNIERTSTRFYFADLKGEKYATLNSITGEIVIFPQEYFDNGETVLSFYSIIDGKLSDVVEIPIFISLLGVDIEPSSPITHPGEDIILNVKYLNLNSTRKEYQIFEIVGFEYVANIRISTYILTLTVNSLVERPDAYIRLSIFNQEAGVESSIIDIPIVVPIVDASVSSIETSTMIGMRHKLDYVVIPSYATYFDVDVNVLNLEYEKISIHSGINIVREGDEIFLNLNNSISLVDLSIILEIVIDGNTYSSISTLLVKRPVTSIFIAKESIENYKFDSNRYYINPFTTVYDLFSVSANSDATYRDLRIEVSILELNLVYSSLVRVFKNYTVETDLLNKVYSVKSLTLNNAEDINHFINFKISSIDNPDCYEEIVFEIVPVYAVKIVGSIITSTYSENETSSGSLKIVSDGSIPVTENGEKLILVEPGSQIKFNQLYFDDEVSERFSKNVTFKDNYSIQLLTTSINSPYLSYVNREDEFFFSAINEKDFVLRTYDGLKNYISEENNRFVIRVNFEQELSGTELYYDFPFEIYCSTKTIDLIKITDIEGKILEISNLNKILVSRGTDTVYNSFLIELTTNKGFYSTNGYEVFTDETLVYQSSTNRYSFNKWNGLGQISEILVKSKDKSLTPISLSIRLEVEPLYIDVPEPVFKDSTGTRLDNYRHNKEISGFDDEAIDIFYDTTTSIEFGNKKLNAAVYELKVLYRESIPFNFRKDSLNFNKFLLDSFSTLINPDVVVMIRLSYIDGITLCFDKIYKLHFQADFLDTNFNSRFVRKNNEVNVIAKTSSFPLEISEINQLENRNILFNYYFDDRTNSFDNYMHKLDIKTDKNIAMNLVNTDSSSDTLSNIHYFVSQEHNGEVRKILIYGENIIRRFISTERQLDRFVYERLSVVYYLVNDIKMENRKYHSDNNSLSYYSDFRNNLNGNGFTISGINLELEDGNLSELTLVGFLGVNNGKIENVNFDVTILGGSVSNPVYKGSEAIIGSIVAINHGTLNNCKVSGLIDVYRNVSTIGGLVGLNYNIISDCISEVKIRGMGNIGGIVGISRGNYDVGVKGSSYIGSEIIIFAPFSNFATSFSVGGICGILESGLLTNCYFGGTIKSVETIFSTLQIGYICGKGLVANIVGCTNTGTSFILYKIEYNSANNGNAFKELNGLLGKKI